MLTKALNLLLFASVAFLNACGGGDSSENPDLGTPTVTVTKVGQGLVGSMPAGINCGNDCSVQFNPDTAVTLNAMPAEDYDFVGWSADDAKCSGSAACTVGPNSAANITAIFEKKGYWITLTINGSGTVSSSPSSINCSTSCNAKFGSGMMVTLTPVPAPGYRFSGWSGNCSGSGTCNVTMSHGQAMTATFVPDSTSKFTLSVSKIGSGSVSSSPSGIGCGTTCSASFTSGTVVTLTAVAEYSYAFSGWSGACSGTGACTVTMSQARSVIANFVFSPPTTYTLTVNKTGLGSVSSSPSGIGCGSTCSANFNPGTVVTLTAVADFAYTFSGWGGACSGTGTCTVTMSQARSVTATFATSPTTFALTVSKSGSGSVSSSPSGISCGSTCSANFSSGTVVTLTPLAASGYTFSSWSGACTGSGACSVTMSQARSVTATFVAIPPSTFALSVSTSGSGAVSSSPSGISCGSTCSANFSSGTVVTLTPLAASGYTFSAWGGDCAGSGTCSVTMSQARSVTATFVAIPPSTFALSVSTSGSGSVSSSPSGISCGSICSASFSSGTVVTLTAVAGSGYTFSAWGGACSGSSTCSVTMSQARSVTATFVANPPSTFTLSVSTSGSGSVSSSPAGISCGSTCAANFSSGTVVTLTPTAASGYSFSGWSGSCSGTGACSVTMSQARSVSATFVANPPATFTLSVTTSGSGLVSSSPSGISCGSTCSANFTSGTVVTLTATPASGASFNGWSGSCTGSTSSCTITMSQARAASASFTNTGSGRSYFVSTTGSDSANGTSLSSPFRTINKAVSVAAAGDTIDVRAGTYAEAVVIRSAGSSSAWITLRGYNGERPIIRRTGSGPTLYFYNNACDQSVIGNGSGNTDCYPMYWVIQGLEIRGSSSGGGDGNAIKVDTPKVRIQNNKLCCTVADVVKVVRTANDAMLLNNEIWQDSSITTPSANAQGIDITGADRVLVAGNYVHDVPNFGMYAKANARNTVFENNLLFNIGNSSNGHALMLGQSSDVEILVDGNYESYDGIIRNNLVVNATWACLATSSSFNVRIYNNSCYNTGTTTHGSIFMSTESEIGTEGLNVEIINNIVYGSASRPIIKINPDAMSNFSTLKINNNLYYVSGGAPTFQPNSNNGAVNFSQWLSQYTSLTGRTDTSRVLDPLYSTTAGTTPLTLQASSPAINAGQSTSLVTKDYRGIPRPQSGAIDIGAYEY